MDVCALIPARGGSKGIPQKNLREVAGLPLVAHSIRAAQAAPTVNRVFVTTEDPRIGEIARSFGAEVIRRPPELSGDEATSESALSHALDVLETTESLIPDLVVFLQPTSPLRPQGAVQGAIDQLLAEDADSAFSACEVRGFAWRMDSLTVTPLNYEPTQRPRRQDLREQLIMENGSIYLFKPWVLRETACRLGGRITAYLMSPLDSFEIDVPSDLDLFERLFRVQVP